MEGLILLLPHCPVLDDMGGELVAPRATGQWQVGPRLTLALMWQGQGATLTLVACPMTRNWRLLLWPGHRVLQMSGWWRLPVLL